MEQLKFSHNWNSKLGCNSFTTLRLRNDQKYFIGKDFEVVLKSDVLGCYKIIDIKYIKISQITEFIARLDTGYSKDECIKMIKTMYCKMVNDWNNQELSFCLLLKSKI